MLQPFPNVIQGVEDHPVLGEGTHQVPVPHPTQAVFRDQTQLGPDAAGILEPDLVLLSPSSTYRNQGAWTDSSNRMAA